MNKINQRIIISATLLAIIVLVAGASFFRIQRTETQQMKESVSQSQFLVESVQADESLAESIQAAAQAQAEAERQKNCRKSMI